MSRYEDLETVSESDRVKLESAGYHPELRWRRTIGEGTSVVCTTSEALKNIEIETQRARRSA